MANLRIPRSAVLAFLLLAHVGTDVSGQDPDPPARTTFATTEADQHLRGRGYDDAIRLYREVLEQHPDNLRAWQGLVRSLLRKHDLDEALRVAREASEARPESAGFLALLGDVRFRRAEFDEAEAAYTRALSIEENARAQFGLGRLLRTQACRKSAVMHFERAHELDPRDPEIGFAWAWTRGEDEATLEHAKDFLELAKTSQMDGERIMGWHSRLAFAKLVGDRHFYRPADRHRSYRIPLKKTGGKQTHRLEGAVYVQARFNDGKPVKLRLDTGWPGIILHAKAAKRSEIRLLTPTKVSGLGDEGSAAASFGLAETLAIGELTLHDCPVVVSEDPDAIGVIGTLALRGFLIRLDYPRKLLTLDPLPDRGDDDWIQLDCVDAEKTERLTPVRQSQGKLLIEAAINDRTTGWLLLDSGAHSNVISIPKARQVTSLVPATGVQVSGASGVVDEVYAASRIIWQFAGIRQENRGMIAVDLSRVSDDMGFEVSGLVGNQFLGHLTLEINYRDGLVDLITESRRTAEQKGR